MTIDSYHAHVYYDEKSKQAAEELRSQILQKFVVKMGRWREEPVGPHPQAMYQVAFQPEMFATIVPWLLINRKDLDILIHPNTGASIKDHTSHALWLGNKLSLRLGELEPGN